MHFTYSPTSSTTSSPASSFSSNYSTYSSYSMCTADLGSSKKEYSQSSCAFPSWPRRESLSSSSSSSSNLSSASKRPIFASNNSYISDEDLFPDVFEEEADSAVSSPCRSPQITTVLPERYHRNVEIDLWTSAAAVRAEKQARKQQRRNNKKQAKSASKTMTPIREVE